MLTGNEYGQAIAGTIRSDTLQGGGSSVNGGDILIGLGGMDTYIVDAPNILLIELDNEGIDTAIIQAAGSGFTLNGESYVDNLDAEAGTASINITGNLLAQNIRGNNGNNVLSTGGGGNDTLFGALGDDTYRVHGNVTVVDTGGFDTIYASGSFRLFFAISAIEVISTSVHAETAAIDLIGNDFAQTIVGNFGSNLLDGGGGNDTLIGLSGSDVFAFSSPPGTGNVDIIQDFVSGTDKIGLSNSTFFFVTTNGVAAGEFVLGSVATSAESRLIYDQPAGRLLYDPDANGAAAAVLFAQLAPNTALSVSDFTVLAPYG